MFAGGFVVNVRPSPGESRGRCPPFDGNTGSLRLRPRSRTMCLMKCREEMSRFRMPSGQPMCEEPDPLGTYKRGPHLHVSVAKSPIAHSHFSFYLGQLEEVLASCDDLSRAISLALKVVRDEVVARL